MSVRLIRPRRLADARGWFCETYSRRTMARMGITMEFVQDNHSFSRAAGAVRGLHFQRPPHAQAKLVRCVRGAVWDVAVDLRGASPTYGKWAAAELDARGGAQMFIPAGYGHGFVTLEPETEIEYKVSDFHAADHEGGIAWNDPDLALPWPLPPGAPILSNRDRGLPAFAGFVSPFDYDGVPLTAPEP